MHQMSPEVLIYIQNIKKFFLNDEHNRAYFAIDRDEDAFFKYVAELSEKNFEEFGEPALLIEQFESIKKKIYGVDENSKLSIGMFISLGDLGYVSLN